MGTLSFHFAELAKDETPQPLVVRGVVRVNEPAVILILSGEVAQGLSGVGWDVIQRGTTFTASRSEVARHCSLGSKSWLGFAEVAVRHKSIS